MQCKNHPEQPSTHACGNCLHHWCDQCVLEHNQVVKCPDCRYPIGSIKRAVARTNAATHNSNNGGATSSEQRPPNRPSSTPYSASLNVGSFWGNVFNAFFVPISSGGFLWMGALAFCIFLTLGSIGLSLNLHHLPQWFYVLHACAVVLAFVTPFVTLSMMGTCFRSAVASGLGDSPEGDHLAPPPLNLLGDIGEIARAMFGDGLYAAVLVAILMLPGATLIYIGPENEVAIFSSTLIPIIYIPMALGLATIRGETMSIFKVVDVLRGIILGGLPYVFTVLLGIVMLGALQFVFSNYAFTYSYFDFFMCFIALPIYVTFMTVMMGYLVGRMIIINPRFDRFL